MKALKLVSAAADLCLCVYRKEICNSGASYLMCPLCNTCKAWNMSDICTMAKVKNCQIMSLVNHPVYDHNGKKTKYGFFSFKSVLHLSALQMGYLFDHPGTVFFSVFMSFWAVTFLEYWKRKMATLAHHWDCMDFHEEEVS